jgi:hypothetical protein
MPKSRPQPPRPDRRRSIRGSFSWIDHRFLRERFDQGLTRLEKLFYFVLVAVSNQDGVSFYSDARLTKLLDIRFSHELDGARRELARRDLIAYEGRIYQVLDLPISPPWMARASFSFEFISPARAPSVAQRGFGSGERQAVAGTLGPEDTMKFRVWYHPSGPASASPYRVCDKRGGEAWNGCTRVGCFTGAISTLTALKLCPPFVSDSDR